MVERPETGRPYPDPVAPISFRRRPTRIAPDELAERLGAALREAFPDVEIGVHTTGHEAVVSWHDGPAAGSVADVVGTVVNWDVRTPAAPPERAGTPSVVLERTFSDRALAVAVARFAGANVAPYRSDDARAVGRLSALLEVDDPAVSGYPVPDAVAGLLLEAPRPPMLDVPADPTRADVLAATLAALGYERLWEVAWAAVR